MTNGFWASMGAAAMVAATLAGGSAQAGKLVRIATMPAGAEVTGVAVNDLGELFFNAQHPGGKSTHKDGGPAALVGYIPSLDINSFSGAGIAIPGENDRGSVQAVSGGYRVLAKSGDKFGNGQVMGGVYDTKGNLMFISNDVDFNALIPLNAKEAYLYTAFEGGGRLGVSAVSRLKLIRSQGEWQADFGQSKMIDLSGVEGGWVMCYGAITPWGTPLFAEEYYFYNTALWNHPALHDEDERPSYKKGNDMVYHMPKMMNRYLGRASNPYRYGYNIEMNNAASENDVSFVKHYVMGRLSHENAAIMPDGRTAYQSDDDSAKYTDAKYNTNSGGVLFKFVADHKADLSSGTLYAAKLTQDAGSDIRKTGFAVSWVELAHGDNATIGKWIAEYDGIGTSAHVEGQSNYISDADVNNWAEGKLGKDLNGDGTVGSYKDDRPAFLESRKAAAALGATNEWNKLEGVTATRHTFYLAASEVSETMAKGWGDVGWATGAKDKTNDGAIALDKEGCGAVYAAKLTADYNITRLEPFEVGTTTDGKKQCDPNGIAKPDNIFALAGGGLLIGEDAGRKSHPVDMLWLKK